MFKAFEFCLPTNATKVPAGPEWFHEIKQDGFRIRVERDSDRVRLVTRGYAWTAGADLMPAGLTRWVFLLPLPRSICCCWLSGPTFLGAIGSGRENLAAHRCSHLF